MSIETPWLTVPQASTYARRHQNTIRAALADGTLKGSQRMRKGSWLIHRDDLDAYVRGEIASVKVPAVSRRGNRAS